MTNHKEELRQLMNSSGEVSKEIPETMQGFSHLAQGALQDGDISVKHKELIALGIAISLRCKGCIQVHVRNSIDAGATRKELHEAISVAILMCGAPGTVYGAIAHEIIDEFLK